MVHFRIPGFFRSSNSSFASVDSHSKAASQSSTLAPTAAATPAATTPVVVPVAAPVAAPVVAFADTVEQVHEVLPKHEKHSEAHQIYRDQAGHAPKGISPQTVNPVRSVLSLPAFWLTFFVT
jgi:hypothetical protein